MAYPSPFASANPAFGTTPMPTAAPAALPGAVPSAAPGMPGSTLPGAAGTSFFGGLFGDPSAASQDISSGAQYGSNWVNSLYPQAGEQLTSAYRKGLDPSQDLFRGSKAGLTAYGNATGINGPAGNQQALDAFWNSPQVAAAMKGAQATTNAVEAAAGKSYSGNALIDAQNYLTGQVIPQQWQSYVNNLNPYFGQSQQAAGNILQGYGQLGQGQAGITTGQAGANAGLGLTSSMGQANAALAGSPGFQNLISLFGGALGGAAKLPSSSIGGSALSKIFG